jgi:hypothetical protein
MDASPKPAIPEPILNYCFGLLPDREEEGNFGTWQDLGQYWVWSAALPNHEERLEVREKTDKGLVALSAPGHLMHPIGAGTMHQVAHLFGYWMESDTDRIWIQISRPKGLVYVMIWGGGSGARLQERVLWVCPKCGEQIGGRTLSRTRPSIDVFESQQLEAVRHFNSDATQRTCRVCAFVHPAAYGFYPENDAPAEKLARKQW